MLKVFFRIIVKYTRFLKSLPNIWFSTKFRKRPNFGMIYFLKYYTIFKKK